MIKESYTKGFYRVCNAYGVDVNKLLGYASHIEKLAQFEIPNFLASEKINSDKTNEELAEKIDSILERLPEHKKKSKRKYVSIRGADSNARAYVSKNREKILSLIQDIVDKREQ